MGKTSASVTKPLRYPIWVAMSMNMDYYAPIVGNDVPTENTLTTVISSSSPNCDNGLASDLQRNAPSSFTHKNPIP